MPRSFMVFCTVILMAVSASSAGLTDAIDIRDGETVGDFVGGHDMRRPARVIKPGEPVSFELRVTPGEPITLEIEEMHGRAQQLCAYLIYVDGVKTYFRTWQTCGAGPAHFFVHVPPARRERVTVRFENVAAAPVHVSRIWAWSDFEKFFDANGFAVPYHIAPTVRLSGDVDGDLAKLRQIISSLRDQRHVKPAWTTSIPYAAARETAAAQRIDYALKLADLSGMPVQMCFDSWWANTPRGPDGTGGRWTDVRYQQRVWNDTQQRMQLSVPNRWSNTPWLTVNDSALNAFKRQRLAQALAHLRSRDTRNVLAINLDNEPIYWASGNAGLGADLLFADFHPAAVAAAAADGIVLDPRDGLCREERLWLWKNLLRYNEMIASTAAKSLRGTHLDVYTQAMMMSPPRLEYPMCDAAHALWESAAPRGARVGGEWSGDWPGTRQRILHQLALGRTAAVNAECEDRAADPSAVAAGYALGQRYFAPYNTPLDTLDVATAALNDLSVPFRPFAYEPTSTEIHLDEMRWPQSLAEHEGLELARIGNSTAIGACPASSSEPGVLSFDLPSPPAGLVVEVAGRAKDFAERQRDVRIGLVAGGREIGVIRDSGNLNATHRFDLTDVARGNRPLRLRFELHAPDIETDMLTWCAIYSIRFTTPWPTEMIDGLPPQDESLRLTRKQHLMVSWRRDAELALENSPSSAAQELYDQGLYADVCEITAASQ